MTDKSTKEIINHLRQLANSLENEWMDIHGALGNLFILQRTHPESRIQRIGELYAVGKEAILVLDNHSNESVVLELKGYEVKND